MNRELKIIRNWFQYCFWWVLIWNIWTIFILFFTNINNTILKIVIQFVLWFVIPFLIFINLSYSIWKCIIKYDKKILRKIYFIFMIIVCIGLSGALIICFAISINNYVITPEAPTTFKEFIFSIIWWNG